MASVSSSHHPVPDYHPTLISQAVSEVLALSLLQVFCCNREFWCCFVFPGSSMLIFTLVSRILLVAYQGLTSALVCALGLCGVQDPLLMHTYLATTCKIMGQGDRAWPYLGAYENRHSSPQPTIQNVWVWLTGYVRSVTCDHLDSSNHMGIPPSTSWCVIWFLDQTAVA